jgi:hypothetical protein
MPVDYSQWVGKRVRQKSGKPFKSAAVVGTVKEVLIHPQTNRPAFFFVEDDSYVESRSCELVAD